MKKTISIFLVVLTLASALTLGGCKKDVPDDDGTLPLENGQENGQGNTADEQPREKTLWDFVNENTLLFTDKDLGFIPFSLGASEDELLKVMGEPYNYEEVYDDLLDIPLMIFQYVDFGFVKLNPVLPDMVEYTVSGVMVASDTVVGPRGTGVGDHYLDVVSKFYVDESIPDEIYGGVRLLYQYPEGEMFITGRLLYEEGGILQYIHYTFTPLRPDGSIMGTRYTLSYIIENDHVLEIGLLVQ